MNKATAIKRAGSTTALASLLNITRQAVEKWNTLPPLRVYQLRELKPEWFVKGKK
jgi:DNA-binding transcriptional regulator Cro